MAGPLVAVPATSHDSLVSTIKKNDRLGQARPNDGLADADRGLGPCDAHTVQSIIHAASNTLGSSPPTLPPFTQTWQFSLGDIDYAAFNTSYVCRACHEI